MITKDFVIIGAGIAGFSAMKAIREENKEVSILWVTDEDRIPYKRTKINKNIAAGFTKNEFSITDHDWLLDNHIELLYDRVEVIDPNKHELIFKHRGHLRYEKLIITIGNIPNKLPIDDLPLDNIYHVHTALQTENIIRTTITSKKYLVIGAGVEGVETAEQLLKLKKDVVLIDKNNQVLPHFFTPRFSDLLINDIQKSDIQLYLNVKNITYREGEYDKSIINIDGTDFEFDTIISTIGYSPNIKLAYDSNIDCSTGILVNDELKTSAVDIYAAGDVVEHPSGEITGLWHAAEKQGYIAGKNALGKQLKFELQPYRMKTEVFGEFYFSVIPKSNNLDLISEEKGNVIRDLYFKDDKLEALLMKNDKDRAKTYQLALMEKWSLDKIHTEIPL